MNDMTTWASTADLPPEIQAFFAALYQRALTRFARVLAESMATPDLCEALARERVGILDDELAPVFPAMAAAGTPVACAKGCGACCTTTVEVTPEELFAVYAYLKRTLPDDEWTAFMDRAIANDREGHGLDPVARHRLRLFCPVLDPKSMACLAHPVRPAPCQGYLSVNLNQCLANHQSPPHPVAQPEIASMITSVVNGTRVAVLGDLGLDMTGLELTAGLVALHADPDAAQRWRSGAHVLTEARYIPSTILPT